MTRQEYLTKVQSVITRADGTGHLPDTAPIVAMFAERYMPIVPPTESGDNMTSYEIVQLLEDTCQLTTTEVAAVMLFLGYRLHVNGYRGHEWAMRAAPDTSSDTDRYS